MAGKRALTVAQEELLGCGLYELGLQERTVNHLEKLGIHTVEDLLMCQPVVLRRIPNVGDKTLEEIYSRLAEHGFHRTV